MSSTDPREDNRVSQRSISVSFPSRRIVHERTIRMTAASHHVVRPQNELAAEAGEALATPGGFTFAGAEMPAGAHDRGARQHSAVGPAVGQ
jgi:hypothetical protein